MLNSPIAARMGIFMVRAFVRMRRELVGQSHISRRLEEIDKTLLIHDEGLRDLYQKLMPLLEPEREKRKIGF